MVKRRLSKLFICCALIIFQNDWRGLLLIQASQGLQNNGVERRIFSMSRIFGEKRN